MATILENTTGTLVGVGAEAASAAHVQVKSHGAYQNADAVLGHYVSQGRFIMVNSQAAATQSTGMIVALANRGPNVMIMERWRLRWTQTAAHTVAIHSAIALMKCWYPTPHTSGDTTGTIVPVRSDGLNPLAQTKAAAQFSLTAANGFTGAAELPVFEGGNPASATGAWLSRADMWMLATQPTTELNQSVHELILDEHGSHPITLVRNEALVIVNLVALGAAAGSSGQCTIAWSEAKTF